MADNVAITAGSGTTVATDDIGGVQYQRQKLTLGPDGTATADAAGRVVTGTSGALYVDNRPSLVRLQITPVISSSPAYTSGDCLGPLTTISNAARYSGGGGLIRSITVVDKTQAQRANMDLVLFDRTVTTAADNAAFQCSDADMLNCIGVIPLITVATQYNTAWPGTPLNSIATIPNHELTTSGTTQNGSMFPFPFVLNGTDLFAQLVVRGTPTYTSTSDIVVSFTIEQF